MGHWCTIRPRIRIIALRLDYLHSDYGVDKEKHGDQENNVGKGLETLHECPEKYSDGVALTKQLDQTGSPEQP